MVDKTERQAGVVDQMDIFIDNGHHTIKCMRVDNLNFENEIINHFEMPTWLLKDLAPLIDKEREKMTKALKLNKSKFHLDIMLAARRQEGRKGVYASQRQL